MKIKFLSAHYCFYDSFKIRFCLLTLKDSTFSSFSVTIWRCQACFARPFCWDPGDDYYAAGLEASAQPGLLLHPPDQWRTPWSHRPYCKGIWIFKKKSHKKKKLGGFIHQAKCWTSTSNFNVLRAGYTTPKDMKLRRRRRLSSTSSCPSSPASSPRKSCPSNKKKIIYKPFPLLQLDGINIVKIAGGSL